MATRSASISVTSGSYNRNVEGSTLTQPTFIIDSATSNTDRGGSTKVRKNFHLFTLIHTLPLKCLLPLASLPQYGIKLP